MRYDVDTQILDVWWPVAKKPHVCRDCDQVIEPGDRYCRMIGVIDGGFVTLARHTRSGVCPGDPYDNLPSWDLA